MAKRKKQIKKSKKQNKQAEVLVAHPLDIWLEILFYLIIVGLPVIFSRITFDQFDIAKLVLFRILTILIVILWLVRWFSLRKLSITYGNQDLFLLGFLIVVIIATYFSIHIPTAIHGKYKRYEGLLTFLNYGIIYFLAAQVLNKKTHLERLAKITAFTGMAVAFYGLLQFVGADPLRWGRTPFEARKSFSSFGNPDLLAGYLVIVIPVILALYLSAKEDWQKLMYGGGFLIVSSCLLTTFTRGAWLATTFGLVLFSVLLGRKILAAKAREILILAVIFLAVFVFTVIGSIATGQNSLNLINRLNSITKFDQGSVFTRKEIWKAAIKMVEDRPLFGLGPDTFRIASEHYETFPYVKAVKGVTVADNAHNYVLQIAAGTGLLGITLFLVFIISSFIKNFRQAVTDNSSDKLIFVGLTISTIAYFSHLLFGLSVVGSSAVFWIFLGALLANLGNQGKASKFKIKINYRNYVGVLLVIILVIPTFIASYFGIRMLIADHNFAFAFWESSMYRLDAMEARMNLAHKLYPSNGRYRSNAARLYLQIRNNSDLPTLDKIIGFYKEAIEAEPLEVDNHVFLSNAYYMKGNFTKNMHYIKLALKEARWSVKRRPYSRPGRYMLGLLYFRLKKYHQAIKNLLVVEKISGNFEKTYFLLAESYKKLGNKARAAHYSKLLNASSNLPR